MLPSKTIPEVNNRKGYALKTKTKAKTMPTPAKKKARTPPIDVDTVKEVDANKSTHNGGSATGRNATISPASSFQNVNSIRIVSVCCLLIIMEFF